MNTDNVSLACETIDFGPCAFMDSFHPRKVFSSIDHGGRYAYSNQPSICLWNLAQFATTLVPILGSDQEEAVKVATDAINGFQGHFTDAWLSVFRKKLGLLPNGEDEALISDFLGLLAEARADFTVAFRRLSDLSDEEKDDGEFRAYLGGGPKSAKWLSCWRHRLRQDGRTAIVRQEEMKQANPALIPRNHLIEKAISEGVAGEFSLFNELIRAWATPFADHSMSGRLALPPTPDEIVSRTFCGT